MNLLATRGVLDVLAFVFVILALIVLQPSVENSDLIILPFAGLVFLRLLYLVYKGEISLSSDVFNFKGSVPALSLYAAFTIVAILGLWLLQEYLIFPTWLKDDEIITFLFTHALVQEVMYRVYLVNRLKQFMKNPVYLALASGAIFGTSHLILPDAWLVFTLTFIAGTAWSYLYARFPNLLYVWSSHSVINLAINFLYL